MPLTICNEHSSSISVAIAYYNPNQCANAGNWTKIGWYNIAPGTCSLVNNANLANVNRNWLYYACTLTKPLNGLVTIALTLLISHSAGAGTSLQLILDLLERTRYVLDY